LSALEATHLATSTRVLYTSDHGDNLGTRGLWGKSTMYEETAAVPMIFAGAGIPEGRVTGEPVSLIDVYPTILDATGQHENELRNGYPGHSLFDIASGETPDRTVLVEYHGMGSSTGSFMIRHGRYKYVYYVGYPEQLFDLEEDPDELHDLAPNSQMGSVLNSCRKRLHSVCDPDEVDRRCKTRQAELLALNGGRDAVIKRGDLGFTPAPGAAIAFD